MDNSDIWVIGFLVGYLVGVAMFFGMTNFCKEEETSNDVSKKD